MGSEKLQPPRPLPPKAVELPQVEKVVLANGLPVYLIVTQGQEVARVSFVWAAGSAIGLTGGFASAAGKPFVASSTLNLLAEGSENLTAHEIAERLDFVGSYFDVSMDRDYALMTFCSLEKFFEPTLEMMAEIVLKPAFPSEEVEIYTKKRMERLAMERSKPATKAREAFSAALFGAGHPYGISSPEAEYMKVTREDVAEFYKRFYGADNCFVVCSLGAGTRKEALLELLGRMPVGSREEAGGEFPAAVSERRRMVTIEGAVQSAIRVGRILFPRQHPDFVGMQVVATILGGYFGSRLVQNLREQRGYTYGVMAAMVNLKHAGYLAIATEVAAEATNDATEQIFNEMERLKTEPVGDDELENVKRSMLGEVARILDGPFGIVDVVIENIQVGRNADGGCGYAINYLNEFIKEVETITPARIIELARKYLDREKFTTVVVGKA